MRAKKILAILLSLVMVLGMMPSTVFANKGLVSGADKAVIEMHVLYSEDEDTTGNSPKAATHFHIYGSDENDPEITYGSNFYIGFYAKDFGNIQEVSDWGMNSFTIQFLYDPTNLRLEPDYNDQNNVRPSNGVYSGTFSGFSTATTGANASRNITNLRTKLSNRLAEQTFIKDAQYVENDYTVEDGADFNATQDDGTGNLVGDLTTTDSSISPIFVSYKLTSKEKVSPTYFGKKMVQTTEEDGGETYPLLEKDASNKNEGAYLAIFKFQVVAKSEEAKNQPLDSSGKNNFLWYVNDGIGWALEAGNSDDSDNTDAYANYQGVNRIGTNNYLFNLATEAYPNPTEGVMELGDLSAVQKKVFPKMYSFSFSGEGGTVDSALTNVASADLMGDSDWSSTDTSSVAEGAKDFSDLPSGTDAPSKDGYAFKGWALRTGNDTDDYTFKPLSDFATDEDGLVIDSTAGYDTDESGNYKLYPIFAAVYTVSVDANGGKFTIESDDATTITSAEVATGTAFDASDFDATDFGSLSYDGYDLVGFNSEANGTGTEDNAITFASTDSWSDKIGAIVTKVNTATAGAGTKQWYAQWSPSAKGTSDEEYTKVNFDFNGSGSNKFTDPLDPASIDVANGGYINTNWLPDNPTWTNGKDADDDDFREYTFLGWNTKQDGSGTYLITKEGTNLHQIKGDSYSGTETAETTFDWAEGDDTPKEVTYYAIWSKGSLAESDYAVKVVFNDVGATKHVGAEAPHSNTTSSTLTVGVLNSGDALGSMMPSEPEITSKGFGGWFVDKDGSGSLDDTELAADPFTSATPVDTTLMTNYADAGAVKLIAQWIDSYTIKFDANAGGTLTAPTTTGLTFEGTSPDYTSVSKTFDGSTAFAAGDLAKMFASVQRTDYKLIGWNTKADGTDTTDATTGTLAITWADTATASDITTAVETAVAGYGKKNLTLYAIWEANGSDVKTVSFDLNVSSGTAAVPASYSPIKVNNGDTIAKANLPTPTRENYAFIGWYVDDATGKEENKFIGTPVDTGEEATVVNDDITLYARWSAQDNDDDATVEFYDWDTTTSDYSTTAYATVKVGKYGDPLDGSMPSDPPAKTGYAFKNWYIAADAATAKTNYAPGKDVSSLTSNIFTKTTAVGTTAKETVKVYAYYVPEYKVSFNPNGGTIAKEGGTIGSIGTVKATSDGTEGTDYYAVGIETGKSLTDGIDEKKLPVAANDATEFADAEYVYKVSRVFKDASENEHAYTFKEWNTKADGSGTAYTNLAAIKAISAAAELYAIWEYTAYDKVTVSFHQNEGEDRTATGYTPYAEVAIAPGDKVDASLMPADPATTRTGSGYVFDEWNKATNGSGDTFDSDVAVSANLDVYAIWKPDPEDTGITARTVKFATGLPDTTDGVVTMAPDELSVVDGTTILEANKPNVNVTTAPSGKTLGTEWKYYVTANENDTDRVDTAFVFGTTPVTGDWTIYPVWKDDYVVTFSLEGGSIDTTVTSTHAGTRTNATDPYVVTNKASDALDSADIPDDDDVTRTGYTFMGWSTASNGSVEPKLKGDGTDAGDDVKDFVTTGTSITLYAIWEPANAADTYIVNFDDNGTLAKPVGTASNPNAVKVYAAAEDENATYTKAIMPNIPVRAGYEFKGWAMAQNATTPDFFTWDATNEVYTEASKDIAKTDFTEITTGTDARAHETTVYAVWEAIGTLGTEKFTVTFEIGTGEGTIAPASIVVAKDDVLTEGMMATVTAADGWSFQNAWKYYPTGGDKDTDSADFVISTGEASQSPAATTITQDITIYPVMAENVALKFYPNTDRTHALTSDDATDKANIKIVSVEEGGKLTDANLTTIVGEPTRTGYDFVGWILIDTDEATAGKLYEKKNTGTEADPVYEYIYTPDSGTSENIKDYVVEAANTPLFAAKWEAEWYIKLTDNDMPYDSTKAVSGYEAEIDTIKKDNTTDVTDDVANDYDITYDGYNDPVTDGADPTVDENPTTTKPTALGKYAVAVAAKDMKLNDSDSAALDILKDNITAQYDVLTIRKAVITIGRLYADDAAANTALGYTDTNVNKVENGQKYTISEIKGTEALLAKVVNVDNLDATAVAALTDDQTKAGGDFFKIEYVDPSYDTTETTKLEDLSSASASTTKANTFGDYVAIITLKSPYDTNYTWELDTDTEGEPVFETYEAVAAAAGTPYIKLTIASSASIDAVSITQAYTVKTLKTAATATTLAEYEDTAVAHTDTDAATGLYAAAADVKSKAEDGIAYDKDTKTYYVGNVMPGAELKLTLTGKLVTPSFKLRKYAVDESGAVQSTLDPTDLAAATALLEYDSTADPAQTSYYEVGTGTDEGKYFITISAEDLMAVDGVNTVDDGFYNVLTVEMPSADNNITFKLRLLKNPEIKLNYGNTPYGLIMRDASITDKDAAKTAFNASNMFTSTNLPNKAKANLRYAPQAFGLTAATADDPKNFDRNEYGQGIYNRTAFKDAGFVVTNSLGETIIDTSDSTKDTVPTGASFTRMIQIDQLKVVSNLISVIGDSDLIGKPVVEITTNPTENITALSSIPLRPNIYSMDYAYEDELVGGYALKSRDICLLWTEGDVDMSGAINSGDSTYTSNYYAKRAKPYDKLVNKDKNIVATLHLYRIMDVDQSGAINSGDTTRIKNIYAKRTNSNVYYPAL